MSDVSELTTPTGRTRLVALADDPQVVTTHFETDVRTAITRGLKEYMEQLVVNWRGGRQSKFKKVLQSWAEPEVQAEFPSACVYAVEPGTYDARNFTPSTAVLQRDPPVYVRFVAEFMQQVMVEVWTTDPQERVALTKMLEDAFSPVDWMYGMRLELPHYHGMRADFELQSMAYLDAADDAQKRYRKVVFTLAASCTVVRAAIDPATGAATPPATIRVDLEVDDTGAAELEPGGTITVVGATFDARAGGAVVASGAPVSRSGGSVIQVGAGTGAPDKVS